MTKRTKTINAQSTTLERKGEQRNARRDTESGNSDYRKGNGKDGMHTDGIIAH